MRVRGVAFWAVQLTWGLPQTLVGAVLCLAQGRAPRHLFHAACATEWRAKAGLSLGGFVFVPRADQGEGDAYELPDSPKRRLLVHEYGHCVQSLILGPFYLPLVVLPSLLWAGMPAAKRYRAQHAVSYYDRYPESWANSLAAWATGERPPA